MKKLLIEPQGVSLRLLARNKLYLLAQSDMPPGNDAGALLDELTKLFVVEIHDATPCWRLRRRRAQGEPAESEARATMSGKVSADLAAQFRDAAFKIGAEADLLELMRADRRVE